MEDKFRVNGSAAYDIHSVHDNTARPLHRPEQFPEAPIAPVKKVKYKLSISPFAVFGTALALMMIFLVIFSYVSMFEARNEISELKNQRTDLVIQQEKLRSDYESSIDLSAIEELALALGMNKPSNDQIRYIQIGDGDTTQVFSAPEERNIIEQIYDAFCGVFSDVAEYFS